jgi:hypothetical protein
LGKRPNDEKCDSEPLPKRQKNFHLDLPTQSLPMLKSVEWAFKNWTRESIVKSTDDKISFSCSSSSSSFSSSSSSCQERQEKVKWMEVELRALYLVATCMDKSMWVNNDKILFYARIARLFHRFVFFFILFAPFVLISNFFLVSLASQKNRPMFRQKEN